MNSFAIITLLAVVAAANAGILAPAAPLVAATASVISTYSAPIISTHSVPLAYSSPVEAAAPVLAGASVDTVVAGPSGTIATSRGLTIADVVAPGYYAW